jgi:hypothetical protein
LSGSQCSKVATVLGPGWGRCSLAGGRRSDLISPDCGADDLTYVSGWYWARDAVSSAQRIGSGFAEDGTLLFGADYG